MGKAGVTGMGKLTQRQKEIEESKFAPKGSNARDEHIEPNNDKMGRTRAAKKMKLAHIQKEIEEPKSAPKGSNVREEHIESDNNVCHKENPQASENIAIQTEDNSQAAEYNAMQTEGNFDAVMDKKMGGARAMKKKQLTHKQKEIRESKSAPRVSNAMAKHIELDNDVHNEDDPHASKNGASLITKMDRTGDTKKLGHKQKEIEVSKFAPKGSNTRDKHIELDNDLRNEGNPQTLKNNAIQTITENSGARTKDNPPAFEDNTKPTEGKYEAVLDKQIAQFQSRILELEGMVHMLMKNQGKESLREETIPQMSECGKISDKCDLLDWRETDEVVAEGRVVSSDPNELVHKVPLGPNAVKVLILVSRKSDAFLWRPTPSLTYIGDAEDRMVAWPAIRVVSHTIHHSEKWDNRKTSSIDKKCKLYDWSGSEELVAEGRLCSSDPKQLVNDIPLGPSAMAVWVDDPKKRDAFLWRPTSSMTYVGEAVGKKVAWPKSNVVIEDFNVVASLTPTVTAAISPTTTKNQDAFLWSSTSGMACVGEAVSRKAACPKSDVLIEKFNTVASPTPTVNATVSPMASWQTKKFMPKTKCKLIDLCGTEEIVAEGRVFSIDPNALVHFVPLGKNAVKVLVDFVNVPNAVLWRPSSELECIKDVIGTTVAWPAANVIMESISNN